MWDWKVYFFFTEYGGYAVNAAMIGGIAVDAVDDSSEDQDIDNNSKITTTNTLINPTGIYHK